MRGVGPSAPWTTSPFRWDSIRRSITSCGSSLSHDSGERRALVCLGLRHDRRAQRTDHRGADLDHVTGLQEATGRIFTAWQQLARIRRGAGGSAAADDVTRIEGEIHRQELDILGEIIDHRLGRIILAPLIVDENFDLRVERIDLADSDARAQGIAGIEILRGGEAAALVRLMRAADAPVAQQGDTPNIAARISGFDVLALFAEDDSDLAFIVKARRPGRQNYLAIGTDRILADLPEAADAFLALLFARLFKGEFRPRLSALHLDRHGKRMVGVIGAGTGDSSPVGDRRMELYLARGIDQLLAAFAMLGLCLVEEVIDRLLGIFQRRGASLDETHQIGRRLALGFATGIALVIAFAQK